MGIREPQRSVFCQITDRPGPQFLEIHIGNYTPILDTPITDSEHIITHTLIGADSRFLPILSGTNCIFFEKKYFGTDKYY